MEDSLSEAPKGAFVDSLLRNNRQIKQDRALVITESAEMIYKRTIEDMEITLKQMRRERDNMLDLSPTNTQSLVLASEFDAGAFVSKDIELGVTMRNLTIKLEIARERYNTLFTEQTPQTA